MQFIAIERSVSDGAVLDAPVAVAAVAVNYPYVSPLAIILPAETTGGDVDLVYNEETQQLEVVKLSTGMRGPMGGSGL